MEFGGLLMWVPGSIFYVGAALARIIELLNSATGAVTPRRMGRYAAA